MIDEAAEAVRDGKLIVFPTDTVYGIGCDPFDEKAIEALYAAKQRPDEKNIPILIDSIETAEALGEITSKCKELMEKHWPGALTIVAHAKTEFPMGVLKSNGTIALRMPNHEDLLELITNVGGVLAATSANISGKPAILSYDEAYATFSEKAAVILPGATKKKEGSTIIDCTTDECKVLREGPVKI
ncbi:threonylcarbamoyl-AMP synthase [Candidatus Kaiserbacteria bacterium]|nr:MAG: threonylcarbamoyl-AMP synthase [Candidatus Kaiserbacteria bacterium]